MEKKIYILKKNCPNIGKEVGDYYNNEYGETIEELLNKGIIEEEIMPEDFTGEQFIEQGKKEFNERFNIFGECNPPHCTNMRYGGEFSEILDWHIAKQKELMKIITNTETEHVHNWQKMIPMTDNEEQIEWCKNCEATRDSDGGIIN